MASREPLFSARRGAALALEGRAGGESVRKPLNPPRAEVAPNEWTASYRKTPKSWFADRPLYERSRRVSGYGRGVSEPGQGQLDCGNSAGFRPWEG